MAFNYSPKIVSTGLVLCLDAANSLSYPGSGTVWKNVGKNGTDGILINGPTFNGSNSGNIVFDGTNDYATFYAGDLTTTATIEMWCNIGAGYTGKMFMGWRDYDVWCNSGTIGFNTNNGDVYGISSATVSALGCVGNWKQYVFEMRSDVSYTNNKIYINTVSQSLSQQFNSENAGNRNFNGGFGAIAGYLASPTSYPMPMNCASFKVYNRSLTQSEITQNFDALKNRFGL